MNLQCFSKLYTASSRKTTVLIPGRLTASKRSRFCFAVTRGFSLVDAQ